MFGGPRALIALCYNFTEHILDRIKLTNKMAQLVKTLATRLDY